jgi:hypothetical protein
MPLYHIHNPVRRHTHPVATTFGEFTVQAGVSVDGSCKLATLTGITLDEMQAILGDCDPGDKTCYEFHGTLFQRGGLFRAWSVSVWDWKGSCEHGQWSLWAGGGRYELDAWMAYLRAALVLVHEAQDLAPAGWRETT